MAMGAEVEGLLKTISVAAFLLMALALVGLVVRHSLFSPLRVVVVAQVAAVALIVWARLTFGHRSFHAAANPTAGGLVTTGPYRFIRHPIYTGACLLGWAGIMAHLSLINVLLGAVLLVGAIGRMLCEERLVIAAYPEYGEYARVTKRMVPYVF